MLHQLGLWLLQFMIAALGSRIAALGFRVDAFATSDGFKVAALG